MKPLLNKDDSNALVCGVEYISIEKANRLIEERSNKPESQKLTKKRPRRKK